jgi:hypothetical protein
MRAYTGRLQHAGCNRQQSPCNTEQPALQQTMDHMQQTTCSMQQTTENVRHRTTSAATDDGRRTTRDWECCKRQRATPQRATCNEHDTYKDASCNVAKDLKTLQPNTYQCNRPRITDHGQHATVRPTAASLPHAATSDTRRNGQRHRARQRIGLRMHSYPYSMGTRRRRNKTHGHLNRVAGAAAGESQRRRGSRTHSALKRTACCDVLRRPCRLKL